MTSEVEHPPISKIELAILHYIKNNPGVTKTKVVNEMDTTEISSRITTLKHIDILTLDKTIIVRKDKANSQTHNLYLNDEDDFNKINQLISKTETMSKYMTEKIQELDDDLGDLGGIYEMMTMAIIHYLIIKIGSKITSNIKSQYLYARIIEIMKELDLGTKDSSLLGEMRWLEKSINKYSTGPDKAGAEYIKIGRQMISNLNDFYKIDL